MQWKKRIEKGKGIDEERKRGGAEEKGCWKRLAKQQNKKQRRSGRKQKKLKGQKRRLERYRKNKTGQKRSLCGNESCVWFGMYLEDVDTDKQWFECCCGRWIHEDSLDSDDIDNSTRRLCPLC